MIPLTNTPLSALNTPPPTTKLGSSLQPKPLRSPRSRLTRRSGTDERAQKFEEQLVSRSLRVHLLTWRCTLLTRRHESPCSRSTRDGKRINVQRNLAKRRAKRRSRIPTSLKAFSSGAAPTWPRRLLVSKCSSREPQFRSRASARGSRGRMQWTRLRCQPDH